MMMQNNTETNLGMPELPAGSARVSEPPGPVVTGNTSGAGVLSLPKNRIRVRKSVESERQQDTDGVLFKKSSQISEDIDNVCWKNGRRKRCLKYQNRD